MRSLIICLFSAALILSLAVVDLSAAPLTDKELVSLNGETYTADDFRSWWQYWREDNTPFAGSLDTFINWHLLVQEAKRMELYREPGYQQKIRVFLAVRSLMTLKHEEVDSKVDITEDKIRARYMEAYTPIWDVDALYFHDQERAAIVAGKLAAGSSIDEFKEGVAEKNGTLNYQELKLRPLAIERDPELVVLNNLKDGDVSPPFALHGFTVVLQVREKKAPGPEDYEALKEEISHYLMKRELNLRTGELTEGLYRKFNVQYNEKLLARDFTSLEFTEEELETPVATTNRGNIAFRTLVNEVQKDRSMRRVSLAAEADEANVARNFLDSIVAQQVSMWEAVDRHYEKGPLLKDIYDFYSQHRLIKEFEQRLNQGQEPVSDEDIRSYYEKNISVFSSPEEVQLAVFESDQDVQKKFWVDIVRGEDFFEAAKKYPEAEVVSRQTLIDNLDPVVRAEIAKLEKGESSSPFTVQGKHVIVKLIERKASEKIPLDRVRAELIGRLQVEKAAALRSAYEKKLRDLSVLEINENTWQVLQKEFGE